MGRRRVILFAIACLILSVLGTASFFYGSKFALDHLTIVAVAPDVLGQAMKGDHFFRTYRENTLIVSGKALKIEKKGNLFEVTFADTHENHVGCSMRDLPVQPALGSQITIVTEAARAIRVPQGVLLQNCILR